MRNIGLKAKLKPEIDESTADDEVKSLEERLSDMDDVEVTIDETVDEGERSEKPESGSEVMESAGEGAVGDAASGQLGSDSAVPTASEGAAGGVAGKLDNAIGDGGLLQVALGGAIAVGMFKGIQEMAGMAPRGAKLLDMFGTAMMLFFRPFGDFIARALMPYGVAALRAMAKFNRIYHEQGLQVALMWLGGKAKKAFKKVFTNLGSIVGEYIVGALRDLGFDGAADWLEEKMAASDLVTGTIGVAALITGVALTALVAGVAASAILKAVSIARLLSSVSLTALVASTVIGALVKGASILRLLTGVGLAKLVGAVALTKLVKGVGLLALVGKVGLGALVKTVGLASLIAGRVGIGAFLKKVGLGALVKKVGLRSLITRVGLGALVTKVSALGLIGGVALTALVGVVALTALVGIVGIDKLVSGAIKFGEYLSGGAQWFRETASAGAEAFRNGMDGIGADIATVLSDGAEEIRSISLEDVWTGSLRLSEWVAQGSLNWARWMFSGTINWTEWFISGSVSLGKYVAAGSLNWGAWMFSGGIKLGNHILGEIQVADIISGNLMIGSLTTGHIDLGDYVFGNINLKDFLIRGDEGNGGVNVGELPGSGVARGAYETGKGAGEWIGRRMATGGLVKKATQIVAGEGGESEVVAPYSKFEKTLDKERERGRSEGSQSLEVDTSSPSMSNPFKSLKEAVDDLKSDSEPASLEARADQLSSGRQDGARQRDAGQIAKKIDELIDVVSRLDLSSELEVDNEVMARKTEKADRRYFSSTKVKK